MKQEMFIIETQPESTPSMDKKWRENPYYPTIFFHENVDFIKELASLQIMHNGTILDKPNNLTGIEIIYDVSGYISNIKIHRKKS